jgi:hypothetical protein
LCAAFFIYENSILVNHFIASIFLI